LSAVQNDKAYILGVLPVLSRNTATTQPKKNETATDRIKKRL
jgi:hypothetical protein